MFIRMNLVETHLWQNDDWKDQYVGVVPRGTSGDKVKAIFVSLYIWITLKGDAYQPLIIPV